MKKICIIPARAGSKRIPGKNLKDFLGKSIITYAIETSVKSGLFDSVIVSTDSAEIAARAKEAGASVPFMRSTGNASDTASTADVINEVLSQLQTQGNDPEFICCLYPTSVFATIAKIKAGFELLSTMNFDTVISVQQYEHPIQRAFLLTNGKAIMLHPEHKTSRTQDLTPSFHDAAQFYWARTSKFLEKKQLFTDNTGAVEFAQNECHDIDEPGDWILAETKFRNLQSR